MGVFCYSGGMEHNTYILFGRSGSGKGTQAQLLINHLKKTDREVIYLETGQKFREFMTQENYTAERTKKIMETGGLLPVFLPVWLWTNELIQQYTGYEDLILDGICRKLTEAPVLDSALKFYGIENAYVIHINVSNEWAFDRMKGRGRADDTDEYIKSRLDWYDREVLPVLDYFKERKGYNFIEINGEQTIDAVFDELRQKLVLQ